MGGGRVGELTIEDGHADEDPRATEDDGDAALQDSSDNAADHNVGEGRGTSAEMDCVDSALNEQREHDAIRSINESATTTGGDLRRAETNRMRM